MNSHLTAIHRKKISAPYKYLVKSNILPDAIRRGVKILDFGCGYGEDADFYGIEKYDPHFFPKKPSGAYNLIICNYVLNTLETVDEILSVLQEIKGLLGQFGRACITVRADRSRLRGKTLRGTTQFDVHLALQVLNKTSFYRMYVMEKDDILNNASASQISWNLLD
jgi:hypothetical protein